MDDNPLNGIKQGLSIFVNLTLLFFLASVLVLLIWGSPSMVQRTGAFWIAFVVISFGFIKLTVSSINDAAKGKGEFARDFDEKIGGQLKGSRPKSYTLLGQALYRQNNQYTREEVQAYLDDLENHVSYTVVPTDLLVVGLATLLTGFGDLFFCLFRSPGNPICSF